MLILPVLDLKGGNAVHAVRGVRDRYQPVQGVLGSGVDPLALAVAFRERLGLSTVYVADLDAIAGRPGHTRLLQHLADAGLHLWVDAGVSTTDQAVSLFALGVDRVIVGSETLQSPAHLTRLAKGFTPGRLVLSVDLVNGVLQAPPELTNAADLVHLAGTHNFQTVIVLDLSRVGAAAGPPLDLLVPLQRTFPEIQFYAGGGVRDSSDLDTLRKAGAAGALVATAFHRGRLTAATLS